MAMSWIVKFVLAANLIALAALTFAYPHLMVGAGSLIAGHQKLEKNCFACHTPGRGASHERCVACHKLADIGRLTTMGALIAKPAAATPFHEKLARRDCVACHSEHSTAERYRSRGRFDHGLLETASREKCADCHKAPEGQTHRQATGSCAQCHSVTKWKPATFNHSLLNAASRERCTDCHKVPADQLHRQAGACAQCHSMKRWKPATFDHSKYFVLEDHHSRCTACHRTNDYRSYTCYSCHAHTPEKIQREHVEEGIRNFDNCVKCHRSADKRESEHGGRD
jgi:hypothetical protein